MKSKLVEWVVSNLDEWRDHRDQNYLKNWQEYERLWRGVWASEDKSRESERSRITSPALQQAIESHTAEIEEAIYGQGGQFFDIEDDFQDTDKKDIEFLKKYMDQGFKKTKTRKAIGDSVLLGSLYGTGIGEIIIKKTKELVPATQKLEGMDATAVGVKEINRVYVSLKPISPQNFLIDPNATCIEEALGVAIEEFVSAHTVAANIKSGTYKDIPITDESAPDQDLETSWVDQEFNDDKIRLIRYYGLVPRALLETSDEEEVVELFGEEEGLQSDLMEEYGDLVEAIVVIADGEKLLKAEPNPYMMQDRPIIAYQDDTVPNRFWGRGVAEKGFNMQKAIDAQIRSHIDSLALTTAPMVAMDATRLPRGSKFDIRPGKSVLTNGNPAEIIMPFKFGMTDTSNIETAAKFENMLLMATGTLDTAQLQSQPVGGQLSIQLSSIIKKNKRTLVNFQDQFLIPFIEKAAWRYMQFDPENFPVKDWKFVPSSTLGMLAREVEQQQFINLMKTLGPSSPLVPILMKGVIETSSMSNKTELLALLEQSMQPDPQKQQMEQAHMQLEMGLVQAQTNDFNANAQKKQAEAQATMVEAELAPTEAKAKLIAAMSNNLPEDNETKEFDRRLKVADLAIKEKNVNLKAADMQQNAEIVKMQMQKST
jgi:hypothetical protein